MSEPPKCQDCGKWVIGPGHEDECPAPSECRCPRDYDSQGDHHPDCPLNKPAPAAQPAPDAVPIPHNMPGPHNLPPGCDMRQPTWPAPAALRQDAEYPTIVRLAAPDRGTVQYQGPELVREAIHCWNELRHAREELARANAGWDALAAEVDAARRDGETT